MSLGAAHGAGPDATTGAYAGDVHSPETDRFGAGGVAWMSILLSVIFIPFAFSEEFTNGALDAVRSPVRPAPNWLLTCVDLALILVIASLATRLRKVHCGDLSSTQFGVWLAAGSVATLAIDWFATGMQTDDWHNLPRLGFYLAADAGWLAALAVICTASLGVSPLVIVGRGPTDSRRDFRVLMPLLVGTAAAWLAGQIWDFGIERNPLSGGDFGRLGSQFFPQLSQVIPLLLVALAVEARFFQRASRYRVQRAASIVTVAILCVGEIAVVSVLASAPAGASLEGWHEFIAFVLASEAVLVGLTTVILVATEAEPPTHPAQTPTGPPRVEPDPAPCNRRGTTVAAVAAALSLAYIAGLRKRRDPS